MCIRVGLNHTKKGSPALAALVTKPLVRRQELLVHRLHALGRQRPGVLDLLPAHLAEARVHGRSSTVVAVARSTPRGR
jgi:hypothetical protein